MVTNGCGHSTLSQNQTDRVNSFLDTDTNVRKLKVTKIIFGWAWSKIGMVF